MRCKKLGCSEEGRVGKMGGVAVCSCERHYLELHRHRGVLGLLGLVEGYETVLHTVGVRGGDLDDVCALVDRLQAARLQLLDAVEMWETRKS